jgi:hypothetical protein
MAAQRIKRHLEMSGFVFMRRPIGKTHSTQEPFRLGS